MRTSSLGITVLLFGLGGWAEVSPCAVPQDGRDAIRFRTSAGFVPLDVAVTTREGRYVPGLAAEDFLIFEDGDPQSVAHFEEEPSPLSIVLLLDVSSSIRPSLDGLKAGAYRFIGRLAPDDQLLIGFFNDDLWFTKAFTNDTSALVTEIRRMRPRGLTALYDAILESLRELDTVSGRRALVLFADGDDSRPAEQGSTASRADAIEAGKASEAMIYSVGFEGRRAAGRGVNKAFLERLSRNSGGLAFFPRAVKELDESFAQIQRELRSRYRLGYVPTNRATDGSWRRIEVRIAGAEDLHVRTRLGYYARPSDSDSGTEASGLDRIRERGELLVGTTGDYRPFSYRADDGSYLGMDIDAARSLAADLGVTVRFVPTSWSTLLEGLEEGRYDIAMSGITRTPERQERAALSRAYLTIGKSPLVRRSDRERFVDLASIDAADVRIGVNPGGTNERFVRSRVTRARIVVFENNLEIPSAVADGRVDVMITDNVEAELYARRDPRLFAVSPERPYTTEALGYLVGRGERALLRRVDGWLTRIERDGELERLRERWLGPDSPFTRSARDDTRSADPPRRRRGSQSLPAAP